MSVSVALKLSTDNGNLLSFGSDNGLYAASSAALPRGGPYGTIVDNSWASASAGTPFYYTLGTTAISNTAIPANTAIVWPIMFARACKFTGAGLNVAAAGAGSRVYTAMYTSDANTGLPAQKITDLAYWTTTATGVASCQNLETNSYSWQPYVLYWVATWAYTTSAYPSITMRNNSSGGIASARIITGLPTVTTFYTGAVPISYTDTATTWSSQMTGPNTLSPNLLSGTTGAVATNSQAPFIWWGLINV